MPKASCIPGVLVGLAVFLQFSVAPPVKPGMPPEDAKEIEESNIEYARYLKEVVEQLESDSEFKRMIANASQEDIKSGRIAKHLEFVRPDIRSSLDEIKRVEVDRLKRSIERPLHDHINMGDDHKFNEEDLRKLVIQATKDLEEIDRKRREEFKEHEMQENFAEKERRKNMTPEQLAKAKLEEEQQRIKQAQHPELNHPMSEDQQKEVWEKVDKMPKEDFDPKTFFYLHDLDGNQYLDEYEVKALLQKELDKVYGSPDDKTRDKRSVDGSNDTAERFEEMERMREHVFTEMDKNKDKMISYDEFTANIKTSEYKNDPGWKTIDEQPPVYSEQEYLEYEKQQQLAASQQQTQSGSPSISPAEPNQGVPVDHVVAQNKV